ncbi:MAG TPA: hypothetical protein VEC56_02070 [Candidatus Krumholzibacteria bacterium]|nr:hypothetical protein [Candidatus Krumholzibacteria bacterium]
MARKVEVSGITGPIWFMGWLFTIGYVHLSFWKAVLALVIWPYYLGATLSL